MQTFLIVVAGVVVGFLLLIALGWTWLKGKIGAVANAIAAMITNGGLTPFRIHLERRDECEWSDADAVATATGHFEAIGYTRVGDFDVPEMGEVSLRAFWHPEVHSYAVLYDHEAAGLLADVVLAFEDGTFVTMTSSPENGMDRPSYAPSFHLELDLLDAESARTLHDRVMHEAIGREAISWRAEDFEHVFTEAYAQEMDWRIARGGVTRGEIERIAALGGLEPPSECQIESIQAMWTCAIAEFISEEVTEAWLADSGLSAVDWERLRDRISVVHDHGGPEDYIEELAWQIVEAEVDPSDDEAVERAHEQAVERLHSTFEGVSLRAGFSEAQALLPEKRRYERLASVEVPWPADIYARPEDSEF